MQLSVIEQRVFHPQDSHMHLQFGVRAAAADSEVTLWQPGLTLHSLLKV